jgi:hypothetical protein
MMRRVLLTATIALSATTAGVGSLWNSVDHVGAQQEPLQQLSCSGYGCAPLPDAGEASPHVACGATNSAPLPDAKEAPPLVACAGLVSFASSAMDTPILVSRSPTSC